MEGFIILMMLLLWIVPMFVASTIWSNKGGSSLVGFLFGLALGWIGVLIAAVANPDSAVLTQVNKPYWGETPLVNLPERGKVCPRCAEEVKAAAQVCRYCGHEFVSA